MTRLLVGTTNPAKFAEVYEALQDDSMEILGLKDFPHIQIIEESGETFSAKKYQGTQTKNFRIA